MSDEVWVTSEGISLDTFEGTVADFSWDELLEEVISALDAPNGYLTGDDRAYVRDIAASVRGFLRKLDDLAERIQPIEVFQ